MSHHYYNNHHKLERLFMVLVKVGCVVFRLVWEHPVTKVQIVIACEQLWSIYVRYRAKVVIVRSKK